MITFNILLLIWLAVSLIMADRTRRKAGVKAGLYSDEVFVELSFSIIVGMYLPLIVYLAEAAVLILIVMP